ncbi:MAG: 2-hydroxychromene-2-carboxylate isomerase [Burkholderiaceae bacterium]|nr:2-hydroxychromene-2-carboxylate isomerase [Burkholderiaceae bacterium]
MKMIEYFVHPSSPWAYLGHRRFMAIARRHDANIVLRPIDLNRIFPISGGLPLPKRAPQRQAYRLAELSRWSRHLGMPLNLHPRHFPVDGVPASLAVIAAFHQAGIERAMEFTARLMEGVWVNEQDISDRDTLAAIASSCGLDAQSVLSASAASGTELDRNTADATEAQVFGVPWYRFAGESFWGQDRLEFVERALASAE